MFINTQNFFFISWQPTYTRKHIHRYKCVNLAAMVNEDLFVLIQNLVVFFHRVHFTFYLLSRLRNDDTKDRKMKMWDLKDLFLKNVYDVLFCLNHHSINFISSLLFYGHLLFASVRRFYGILQDELRHLLKHQIN